MIEKYFTEEQKTCIVEIVLSKAQQFIDDTCSISNHIYEAYAKKRRKYTLTTYILSGFAPGILNIKGISVKSIEYGIGLCQPELSVKNAIFHIYSDGAQFSSSIIKDRAKTYNKNIEEFPNYLLVVFQSNKNTNEIENISLRELDNNANVIEEEAFYKKA